MLHIEGGGEGDDRIQSDWQRNTYTRHTNSMSRTTCSLVLHRFEEEHRKSRHKKKTLPDFPARTERSSLARVYKRRTTSNAIFERRPPTPLLDIPIPFSFISSYFTSAIIPRLVRTVANGVVRASNANQRVPIYFVSAPSSDTTTLKSWNQCRRSRSRQHRATRGSNEESVRPSNMYIMYTVLYSRIFSTIYKTRHC